MKYVIYKNGGEYNLLNTQIHVHLKMEVKVTF